MFTHSFPNSPTTKKNEKKTENTALRYMTQLALIYANGEADEIDKLKSLLNDFPELLLTRADVVCPSGLEVKNVTLYEFALGAGDFKLAKMLSSYFARLPNSEKEQIRQYENYRPHIENMMKQKPYDFTELLDVLKRSSYEDVIDELKFTPYANSELHKALNKFRSDFKPQVTSTPSMHCNYSTLLKACDLYDDDGFIMTDEFKNPQHGAYAAYSKYMLFWFQIIGFLELRLLPANDRAAFAQGIYYLYPHFNMEQEEFKRSFTFSNGTGYFPTPGKHGDTLSGIGFDAALDQNGGDNMWRRRFGDRRNPYSDLKKYCAMKEVELIKLNPAENVNDMKTQVRI